ncbi:MAG: HAD family phosphatase [Chloroflexota bacterium]|nr:HAD family phosphatase [Chloroflexota bacterium]
MTIQAFVFDCGGVLLRDGDARIYKKWAERLGLTPEELGQRLWRGQVRGLAERGQITDEEFWQRVGAELGLNEEAEIAALQREMWDAWVVDEEVLRLIDRLDVRFRLALLSNATDALEGALCDRYGVDDRFETIVTSARVGMTKPEEGIYREVLDQLQLEPQEVVFVDDRAENVIAASALGMHIIWFVNSAELERQLQVYLSKE